MIKGLNHIALTVHDRDSIIEFYHSVLGFDVEYELNRPNQKDILIFMRAENVVLELFVQTNAEDVHIGKLRHFCFDATEIEYEHSRIENLGYRVSDVQVGMSGKKYFYVQDPEGVQIELHE